MYWIEGIITTLITTPLAIVASLAILASGSMTGLGQFALIFIVGIFWAAWNACAWCLGYFQ